MSHELLGWVLRTSVSATAAVVAVALAGVVATRVTCRRPVVVRLVQQVRWPARAVVALVAVRVGLETVPSDRGVWTTVGHVTWVAVILAGTWGAMRAMAVAEASVAGRFDVGQRDNLRARSRRTQLNVMRRVATAAVVGVAGVAVLLTFPWGRQLGASILAAGGIIGVVLGVSGRSTLGNLIAGIQVAFAEPIRIDDVVVVEEQWGNVEEITLTNVVVRLWDRRRLVLPTSYFVEQPFQNWTRHTSEILGAVELWVDHTAPMDGLRQELDRIVAASDRWDGRNAVIQVTDTSERAMLLRAVVSASDASSAWDLRCEVREGLIRWLVREHPESLPRLRADTELARSH